MEISHIFCSFASGSLRETFDVFYHRRVLAGTKLFVLSSRVRPREKDSSFAQGRESSIIDRQTLPRNGCHSRSNNYFTDGTRHPREADLGRYLWVHCTRGISRSGLYIYILPFRRYSQKNIVLLSTMHKFLNERTVNC